jgi:uncharacterized protein involved in exopolysaccharide biosynthesis
VISRTGASEFLGPPNELHGRSIRTPRDVRRPNGVTSACAQSYNEKIIEGLRVSLSTTEHWDDVGAIGLRDLLAWLWTGRWWIVASVVLFTALAAAEAALATPQYRVNTVLISAGSDRAGLSSSLSSSLGELGGLASLAGINLGSNNAETEESLAVLRSREFTERFISENNLMPELFPGKWNATTGKWSVPARKQPTLARAFKYFDGAIRSVMQDKKTGLVTVRIDWTDRSKAATWANDLVKRLNAEMRRRAIAESDASLGFLQKELAATTVVDTRAAINRLIEAQINRRMLAGVSEEYAFRVVDRAMAPDQGDVVWPRKGLLILAGLLVGFAVGSGAVFLFVRRAQGR